MTAPHSSQIIAGRYALLRELTRGGMGAVWVGHDRSLDREVAPTGGALTATGVILGTPHFMSPEQFRSAKRVDHRSDLWSLGALLFQGITGTPAFSGESLGDVVFAISVDPLPVPSAVCPDLPDGVDAFFARANAIWTGGSSRRRRWPTRSRSSLPGRAIRATSNGCPCPS